MYHTGMSKLLLTLLLLLLGTQIVFGKFYEAQL
jgi:hypothetical protein